METINSEHTEGIIFMHKQEEDTIRLNLLCVINIIDVMHISSQRITENIYMYNPTSVFLLFMHENNSFSMF
jgi:hypothetical protein